MCSCPARLEYGKCYDYKGLRRAKIAVPKIRGVLGTFDFLCLRLPARPQYCTCSDNRSFRHATWAVGRL